MNQNLNRQLEQRADELELYQPNLLWMSSTINHMLQLIYNRPYMPLPDSEALHDAFTKLASAANSISQVYDDLTTEVEGLREAAREE